MILLQFLENTREEMQKHNEQSDYIVQATLFWWVFRPITEEVHGSLGGAFQMEKAWASSLWFSRLAMYQNQQAACTAQVGVRWGGQMEMERTNMHACMFVSMETDIDDLL